MVKIKIIMLPKALEYLLQMAMMGWYPKLKDTIIAALVHAVHRIQLAINDRRFNDSTQLVTIIFERIIALTKITYSLSKGWISNLQLENYILNNV